MRRITMLLLLAFLSGCQTEVREVVVRETTVRYVGMEDRWLQSCPTPKPPTMDPTYREVGLQERVDLWSTWYLLQLQQTGVRNASLKQAYDYNRSKKDQVEVTTCTNGSCK